MKKILSFVLLILSIFSILSLSGCSLLPYYKTPKSITIDDKEYISEFYKDLYLVGIEYKEAETSLFTINNHYWWHLEDSQFDMYYGVHKDALYWRPTLYCRKDQYEEAKAYYKNLENFEYYFGIYLMNDNEIKLNQEVDKTRLEQAVSFIVEIDNAFNIKKYEKLELELLGKDYGRLTIYRRSKDKLFTTTRREWIYYEENLYIHEFTNGANDITTVFVLDKEVNIYMVSLLKEYGIVN